jgi:hypothetical protein
VSGPSQRLDAGRGDLVVTREEQPPQFRAAARFRQRDCPGSANSSCAALAEAEQLPGLRELVMRGLNSSAAVWQRFIEGPLLPQLLRLDLSFAVDEEQFLAHPGGGGLSGEPGPPRPGGTWDRARAVAPGRVPPGRGGPGQRA